MRETLGAVNSSQHISRVGSSALTSHKINRTKRQNIIILSYKFEFVANYMIPDASYLNSELKLIGFVSKRLRGENSSSAFRYVCGATIAHRKRVDYGGEPMFRRCVRVARLHNNVVIRDRTIRVRSSRRGNVNYFLFLFNLKSISLSHANTSLDIYYGV